MPDFILANYKKTYNNNKKFFIKSLYYTYFAAVSRPFGARGDDSGTRWGTFTNVVLSRIDLGLFYAQGRCPVLSYAAPSGLGL
jgi:hypothetical protein